MAKSKKRAVDKFFEGYTVQYIPKENGKGMKVVRTYEGDVYKLDSADRWFVLKKIVCSLLLLLFFASCVCAGMANAAANKGKYYVVPFGISLLFGSYNIKGILDLVICKREMTEYECSEYRKEIKYGTIGAMIASSALTAVYIVYSVMQLLNTEGSLSGVAGDMLAVLFGLISIGSVAGIYLIEKKSKYIVAQGKYKKGPAEKKKFWYMPKRGEKPQLTDRDVDILR